MTNVDYKSIKNAHKRIKRYIAETPLITSREINKKYKAKIYFKLENRQKTGSFKLQFRCRPDLICEKLKGIPRDVFRFMVIGSLSTINSYQIGNCLQSEI